MAWLLPELDVGEEPELRPLEFELLELLELLELEDDEPELEDEPEPEEPEPEDPEPEDPEPEEAEPEEAEPEPEELDDPEFVEVEPVADEPVDVEVDALALCVDPGRARASAPAVTTLAMVTAVVADRTLLRPCSLATMARRIPSRCALLMYPILRSWIRKSLHEPSR